MHVMQTTLTALIRTRSANVSHRLASYELNQVHFIDTLNCSGVSVFVRWTDWHGQRGREAVDY